MSDKFKVGDKISCIDNADLEDYLSTHKQYVVYKVDNVIPRMVFILSKKERNEWFFSDRFKITSITNWEQEFKNEI